MASNEYSLYTEWRVEAALDEVATLIAEIVGDVRAIVRGWPEVNLHAEVLEPGDETGRGRLVDLRTKGFLPYVLRWRVRLVTAEFPQRYVFVSDGDFEGVQDWTVSQEGDEVVVRFDWQVRVHKPVVRVLSCVLKPLFTANHRWAMARGEARLREELARRRAAA